MPADGPGSVSVKHIIIYVLPKYTFEKLMCILPTRCHKYMMVCARSMWLSG